MSRSHKYGSRRHRNPAAWASLLLALALAFPSGCKSPTAPDSGEADILISNDHGETLAIYVNGEYRFPLAHKQQVEIDNVAKGIYLLEARSVAGRELVASTEIEVTDKTDYTWTIDDPPDINVTNNSGMSLRIYMDGVEQFDLVDEENRWIMNIPKGEHLLKAVGIADGLDFASTTVDIEEDADYVWTIAWTGK